MCHATPYTRSACVRSRALPTNRYRQYWRTVVLGLGSRGWAGLSVPAPQTLLLFLPLLLPYYERTVRCRAEYILCAAMPNPGARSSLWCAVPVPFIRPCQCRLSGRAGPWMHSDTVDRYAGYGPAPSPVAPASCVRPGQARPGGSLQGDRTGPFLGKTCVAGPTLARVLQMHARSGATGVVTVPDP